LIVKFKKEITVEICIGASVVFTKESSRPGRVVFESNGEKVLLPGNEVEAKEFVAAYMTAVRADLGGDNE
jgi:hypothetical protein